MIKVQGNLAKTRKNLADENSANLICITFCSKNSILRY